jgi:hypothetical protein
VTDGTALSRGDRNRNDRLARLRVLMPAENALLGIDLERPASRPPSLPITTRGCWRDGV